MTEASPAHDGVSSHSFDWLRERGGIIMKAIIVALALSAVKAFVHNAGWEPIETLPLLTALMGGVVFTLAILLAGTLQDFKESERILGELVSQIWRLDRDLRFIGSPPAARGLLRDLTHALAQNLDGRHRWNVTAIRRILEQLDDMLLQASKQGVFQAHVRTLQVWLANIDRIVDRLGAIIETTFARAGYYLAGTVVIVAIGSLLFTHIPPFGQGLFLFGFSVFLMTGLFLLIWDLDNPFAGHARISIHQLAQLESRLSLA